MNPEHKKLNLGCGYIKLIDHWNVDINPRCNPDEVIDLESVPYPWPDNFFEKITAQNILEHLGETPKKFTLIMKELYRISQNQAEWTIMVPHPRSDLFFDDYTHIRTLTPKTFKMFDQTVNFEKLGKISDSTFGLDSGVDLEILDATYNITNYWIQQLQEGIIGSKQLDINLNIMSNVAESVNIFVKVHKPGRCEEFIKKINK